jgi:outer membrane protein OmpA-like peptidoglycan-associated protein
MSRTLLFLFFLLSTICSLRAQVSPHAQRLYNNALRLQSAHQPQKAQQALRKAIKESAGYTDAYSLLGKWLFEDHQFKAAAEVFVQGEKSSKDGRKIFGKAAAKSLLYSGDYATAARYIPGSSSDIEWKKLEAQAVFLKDVSANPDTNVLVRQVGTPMRINTSAPELFPFCSADGERFYFTRRINGMDEDLFVAKRDSCGDWFGAKNMGSPPNSSAQESAQMISADRHYLFLTRCDNRTQNGWDLGGCDLYMAYTADSLWSVPLSFGATINTPSYEGMPCLSSDNRELFFVSDRPGGYGGMDIWSSRFEHGLWQMPRNLGAAINTAGNETAPFIYADNTTLFFASTGHTGMGGSDIFTAHRQEDDTTWLNVTNLGTPINSPYDEASMSLSAAGDTAYFASDRDSAAGNFDIYQAHLPVALKPGAIGYYKGIIYDSISKEPLNYANVYYTDSASGKELYHVVSNRGDASYTIALPANHSYSLMISRIGYQQMLDTLHCEANGFKEPVYRSFPLLPYGYEKPVTDTMIIRLPFQKNSTIVADSLIALLKMTMQPWQEKKGLIVLVNGYTDNTGTPLINEQISYTRARAVSEVLKEMGFQEEMIQTQGWGEAAPIAGNDTEESRNLNRRVELILRY